MRTLRSMAGDTIVEVLIAMAVASAVMGGAFVVVNHTLANSQQAQEHSETLAIAQGQIEQIKKLAGDPDHSDLLYMSVSRAHCFSPTGVLTNLSPAITSLPSPLESDYPVGCKGLGTAGYYRTAFLYTKGATKIQDLFKVHVDWPGATGGQDEVTLDYRPYQP